jgi:hypothetical protein
MNAGRDVERLISTWLVEESPWRAPDRILANAAGTIDRTRQRRVLAAWREPVSIGLRGFAAMAAVLILAVMGAVLIGRSTASIGTAPTQSPTPSPAPTAAGATLAEYRAARDAVCDAAWPQRRTLDARIGDGLTDPATPAAERATKLAALADEMTFERNLTSQLHGLAIPAALHTDEAVWWSNVDPAFAIIEQEIALIQQGKFSEADAVDQAIVPLSSAAEAYESKYNLKPCP